MQSPMAGGATVQSPMAMSSHAPGTPASLGSQTPRLGHGRTMTPQTSMSSSTAPYLTPTAFPAAPPPQPQPPPPGPKMGPPGPVMNSSHPSSSFSLLSTQMQPSTSHALAAQFPPGSALSRLHQYAEGLSAGPDVSGVPLPLFPKNPTGQLTFSPSLPPPAPHRRVLAIICQRVLPAHGPHAPCPVEPNVARAKGL